jgi:hypothetical protein
MSPAVSSRMRRQWTQLMESSEELVQEAARTAGSETSMAAMRLLHDRSEWVVWEKELGAALRKVVVPTRRHEQIRVLRAASFSWIHSITPFRHMRDLGLRGEYRHQLISRLHNAGGFARAMVAEHRNFIRSTCSLVCAAHIGESVFGDAIFIASMSRYQEAYSEYFRGYCDANFAGRSLQADSDHALLPLLKLQVTELRRAILDYPRSAVWLEQELQYRAKSGDTQQIRAPIQPR